MTNTINNPIFYTGNLVHCVVYKAIRSFFPIKSAEFPKFFPMALLMFMILLNSNIVRSIKDSLIISRLGAEVISFTKLWVEAPFGVLFVFLYTLMCNKMSTERAFRYVVCGFLIFFIVFAFVIFPNQKILHPSDSLVDKYTELYPHLRWFIVIWSKWSLIVFYASGELWPTIVCSLLFWQLANKTTSTEEASRFYTFFSLFGQSSILVSASIIMHLSSKNHLFTKFFSGINDPTEIMIKSMIVIVAISGLICLFLHRLIEKQVVQKSTLGKQDKLTLSLLESLRVILKSRYLRCISILMISYSMSMLLIEGLWMSKVREMYPNTEDFTQYQGAVLFATGVSTLLCSASGSIIIRALGWFKVTIIIPLVTLFAGIMFFASVLLQSYLSFSAITPLFVVVLIGGLQNVLCKGVKYSLFDATKEMVYIPLDDELKTKGKAAVDIVGAKIGKSSGAIIQFVIFTIWPYKKYEDTVFILFTFFVCVCALWIYGAKALSNEYNSLLRTKNL